jgi:polyribonucleotide nucleotidyltransferase
MFETQRVEAQIGKNTLSLETGRIARQADGAVVVQYGETMVLVTVVTAPPRYADQDFFPLSVDYREKLSSAGKFPGGFMKREGRPTTKEILTARQIDRPIRPLFPDGYFDEVQIMCSVLSYDGENDPDVLAMIGASAALHISKIPFLVPVGSCRAVRVDDEVIVFPTIEEVENAELNLLLGGTAKSMNMLEVSARESSEQDVANTVETAHKTVVKVCELIEGLREKAGVEKIEFALDQDEELVKNIKEDVTAELYERKQIKCKKERGEAVKELFDTVKKKYCEPEDGSEGVAVSTVKRILHSIEDKVVKKLLLEGKRPDGRKYDEVRPIDCQVGVLPRTHGSALFTRGETQALVSVTLGTVGDMQTVDGLREEFSQSFMLHYNFPPFSVGEVRPIRGPGRREIGHGALAEKALERVKPSEDEFGYTIKINSDITESNGSSSMASVCGGSLALMDAGVPLKKAIAGISVGLISDDTGKYELLTDIVGDEDHFGLMDFKVAGTCDGITAIQLDVKAEGVEHNIMIETLERARVARLGILDTMNKAISEPKAELSIYAPKLITVKIDPELIGKIIGPGGKMIKGIQEQTGANIEIEEDGTVFISCLEGEGHLQAKEIIEGMTQPPKIGKVYAKSKVVSVKDFGAFVEIIPGVEGLCHISELSDGFVKSASDEVKIGDIIPVKLLSIDDQGRLKLSRKAVLIEEKKEKPEDEAK